MISSPPIMHGTGKARGTTLLLLTLLVHNGGMRSIIIIGAHLIYCVALAY